MNGSTVGSLPLVSQWRRGLKAIAPPRRLLVPPWDLAAVLAALRESPYEPLRTAALKWVTFKAAFLLAITSIRRVSELHALCCAPPYLTLNPRSAILRINPVFLPKTTSTSALHGVIELERFPAEVSSEFDRLLRLNCPVRALRIYLDRSKQCRQDNPLFVAFGDNRRGRAVCKQTLARWISECIHLAYAHLGRDDPIKANVHSTRGVAASWAEFAQAGLLTICEAATWTSSLTFAKHYRLDFAKATVGSRILHLAHTPSNA